MDFTIGLESPFSLDYTLDSGQVFRWENRGEWWYGVVSAGAVKIKQEGTTLRCVSESDLLDGAFLRNYFRLDDPIEEILGSIMRDKKTTSAVQKFYGMRLVRQDRWECLASFVLATNSNIPRIKKMIATLCERYGEPLKFEGTDFFSFPKPTTLASTPVADLRECGLGYRAPFLRHVATSVTKGKVDFSDLAALEYLEARRTMLKELFGEKLLLGVGPKVADCVLLYSLGKDEAFPIDVWIARELGRSYPAILKKDVRRRLSPDRKAKLSKSEYEKISSAARSYFGRYAGYAQQYIFMAARSEPATRP